MLGEHLQYRRALVCGVHWPLPSMAWWPGRQRLVPCDGYHLHSPASRVRMHLLLRDLRLCDPRRGCVRTYVNKHSKHVLGNHMHELTHKHKPGGTHPITEGHLPMHDV